MLNWTPISLCALVLLGAQTRARAEERPVNLNDNAALKYWRAFSLMPHLSHVQENKLRRDASKGGTIIAVLVRIAIESSTEEAVAANLPRANAAQLKDLYGRWHKLPPMGTVAAAMLVGEERGFLIWFIREVEKCKDD